MGSTPFLGPSGMILVWDEYWDSMYFWDDCWDDLTYEYWMYKKQPRAISEDTNGPFHIVVAHGL